MIEITYDVETPEAELRKLVAAEVSDAALVESHDEPWLARGLEPPKRTVKQLRADALASLLEHASQPPTERVLTLKAAAEHVGLTPRQLRHDVDEGRFADSLTATRDGERALRFQETVRTWHLLRSRGPDPRVVALMVEKSVRPGERYEFSKAGSERRQTYTRRRDGEEWPAYW